MIPKIIHQTFKTKNLPIELQNVVSIIRHTCPAYEHRLYDDEDIVEFIKENYDDETLKMYNMINPKLGMARADFFRYLLIYKVGGVYLDIKSCPAVNLDSWILPEHKFITGHWREHHHTDLIKHPLGEFQNWYVISEPGHPIIERVIQRMKENIRNYRKRPNIDIKKDILSVTGPICYSKAILETKDLYPDGYYDFGYDNHVGLIYDAVARGHHSVYTGYIEFEPVIVK